MGLLDENDQILCERSDEAEEPMDSEAPPPPASSLAEHVAAVPAPELLHCRVIGAAARSV